MSIPKIKKLTAKEERFCRRYLIDFNATKSAQEIGYSKRSAREIGYRLLTKVHIQARIDDIRKEMEDKFDVTREGLLRLLMQIAHFDIRKLYNKDGSLKKVNELDDETASALSGMDIDEIWDYSDGEKSQAGITKKVKTWSKVQAIQEIAKMLGYTSSIKISGSGNDEKGNPIKEFKVTLNL